MIIVIAILSNVALAWALANEVRPFVLAFAGFSCGFCWALAYAIYAVEKAGL